MSLTFYYRITSTSWSKSNLPQRLNRMMNVSLDVLLWDFLENSLGRIRHVSFFTESHFRYLCITENTQTSENHKKLDQQRNRKTKYLSFTISMIDEI